MDFNGDELTFDPSSPGTPTAVPLGGQFYAVACPSTSQCTAVGGSGDEVTFNPASPGTPTPVTIDSGSNLGSLSCPVTSQCTALADHTLVTFDPASPGSPTTATIDPSGDLWGFACPSDSQCTATDVQGQELTFDPTSPAGATPIQIAGANSLSSIACSSISHCTAVDTTGHAFIGTAGPVETLSVAKSGTGFGTVTSSPRGIDCGSNCSYGYHSGTNVALTATAAAGSTFAGWSGGGCSGTGTCTVTMSAAMDVTAAFAALPSYALFVSKSGSGSGTVTSSPAGLNCGSTCSQDYTSGTPVTLSAAAAAGSTFAGWSGACSGTSSSCTLSINSAQSVTATFEAPPANYTLTVDKTGSGFGTVTSSPVGISCGTTCTHGYTKGTSVTLTAAAGRGSIFSGWSGPCSGSGTCVIAINAAQTVTATFRLLPKPCLVPKVKGKTLKRAKQLIRAHACGVGTVKHISSRTVKKDHVISQKPKPGKRLKHGAKVALVVSNGRS